MQRVLTITKLPNNGLEASAAFAKEHLGDARAMLAQVDTTSLVIALPKAEFDQDDWRNALARDLARKYAPKRVNIIGADNLALAQDLLVYLEGAHGVTGQYLAAHE